jgi:hypothetical protein
MPARDYLKAVLRVFQERMHTLKDVYQAGPYFFTDPDYAITDSKKSKFRNEHSAEIIGHLTLHGPDNRPSVDQDKGEARNFKRMECGKHRTNDQGSGRRFKPNSKSRDAESAICSCRACLGCRRPDYPRDSRPENVNSTSR